MDNNSPLGSQDISSVEDLYKAYRQDPSSVDLSWRHFFSGFDLALQHFSREHTFAGAENMSKEFAILNLIHSYRQRGHLFTKTNPVRQRRKYTPTLDIENFGLERSDLETIFQAGNEIGIGPAKLKDIIAHLEATYCDSIGVEYIYMRNPELVNWLKGKMESTRNTEQYTDEKRRHFFYHLKIAVGFENFIHKKFVGAKRFSLEGAEAMIPGLDAVIERGAELGIQEFIIGMAHRGRLNVLANIMGKPYERIFKEFYGTEYEDDISLGDVKYHLGYDSEVDTDTGNKVKLKLLPNPSHLEAVSGLVLGLARSRIDAEYNGNFNKLAPILIHGDAAIAAQGIVYETTQMSQLAAYKTGGTIHLIINNQVGFTTNYIEGRSSTYATDIAKVVRSPVFHVNGDDVEAVIYTVKLAMEFRQRYNQDVFIDILCYRKYGHNEGDEPRFTQPTLYKIIAKHPNPREIYGRKLAEMGILSPEEARDKVLEFDQLLEDKYKISEMIQKLDIRNFLVSEYDKYERVERNGHFNFSAKTSVPRAKIEAIAKKINTLPTNLNFFSKVHRIVADRRNMILENSLDWAMAELLAYATLVDEGHAVRLSGQDSERGTFAHRHAAFTIEDVDEKYIPLKNVSENQAPFNIYNSLLSEYSVLGFEYGYSLGQPDALTVWEAQFGDFANVAQVVIDQYISSANEKWGLANALTLYLPHGYEGQGPEHSSARIERFLDLAAGNNMQLVIPTTPSNFFHLLRRQVKWNIRLPLVVFTPKSLLRHPQVVSSIDDLARGHFMEVIDDVVADPREVTRIIFTVGKLYYELLKRRNEEEANCVAIVRVEQLYPLPVEAMKSILKKYKNSKSLYWAQDEPENQGSWPYIHRKIGDWGFKIVARPESASPAGGLIEQHKKRLQRILDKVFEADEYCLIANSKQL